MRCAGYDKVDAAAANAAGITVARVPTYSPTSVAEHAVALMFTIERHVALAYARVTQVRGAARDSSYHPSCAGQHAVPARGPSLSNAAHPFPPS